MVLEKPRPCGCDEVSLSLHLSSSLVWRGGYNMHELLVPLSGRRRFRTLQVYVTGWSLTRWPSEKAVKDVIKLVVFGQGMPF